MPNPFFYGGRIENPMNFVGRKTELRAIFSALEHFKDGQAQHISIVGERRIGKSSLLYHVTQIYRQHLSQPERYRFVFVDLDNTHNHTLQGLLQYILKQLGISAPSYFLLNEFDEALGKLHDKNKICPVLCLDEFEHLATRKDEFPDHVYETFRSLGSNNKIAYITASKQPLPDLIHQSNMTSTFPNIFIQRHLGEFSHSEAEELLQHSNPQFSPAVTSKIIQIAGHHPAKLQMVASIVYDARENKTINWEEIKREFNRASEYLNPKANIHYSKKTGLATRILNGIFVIMPRDWIGKTFLEIWMKDKDKVSNRTAFLLGYVIIVIIVLLLAGILSVAQIKQFIF